MFSSCEITKIDHKFYAPIFPCCTKKPPAYLMFTPPPPPIKDNIPLFYLKPGSLQLPYKRTLT